MSEKSKLQKCQFCKEEFTNKDLSRHEPVCPERLQFCEYCGQDIPIDKFISHQKACQNKTRVCQKCWKPVTTRDYLGHVTSCNGVSQTFQKVRPPKFHDYSNVPYESDIYYQKSEKEKGKSGSEIFEDYYSKNQDQKGPSIRRTDPGYGHAYAPKKQPLKKNHYEGDYFSQDRGIKPEYKQPEGVRKFDPKSDLYDDEDFIEHYGSQSENIVPSSSRQNLETTTNFYDLNLRGNVITNQLQSVLKTIPEVSESKSSGGTNQTLLKSSIRQDFTSEEVPPTRGNMMNSKIR